MNVLTIVFASLAAIIFVASLIFIIAWERDLKRERSLRADDRTLDKLRRSRPIDRSG